MGHQVEVTQGMAMGRQVEVTQGQAMGHPIPEIRGEEVSMIQLRFASFLSEPFFRPSSSGKTVSFAKFEEGFRPGRTLPMNSWGSGRSL